MKIFSLHLQNAIEFWASTLDKWSRKSLKICYKHFLRPIIEYGNIIYDYCTLDDSNKIEEIQPEVARFVAGAKWFPSHESFYNEVGWQTLILYC